MKRDWATAKLWLYDELEPRMNTLDDWPRVKRVLEGALACEHSERGAVSCRRLRRRRGAAGAQSIDCWVQAIVSRSFLETPAVLMLERTRP